MIAKLESFLFGKVAGRVVARLAVSAAAYVAAQAAGAGINVNPDELSAALIAGANAAYTWLSEWRAKRAAKAAPAPEAKPA
jgi:hypothetical protein